MAAGLLCIPVAVRCAAFGFRRNDTGSPPAQRGEYGRRPGGGGSTALCSPPPPPSAVPLPRFAGEERKVLSSLQNPPEVVLGILGGGPPSMSDKGGSVGKRSRRGKSGAAAWRGAHLRCARAEPVLAEISIRDTTTPIQADFSGRSRAAAARRMHVCIRSDCVRSSPNRARMCVLLSMPGSIHPFRPKGNETAPNIFKLLISLNFSQQTGQRGAGNAPQIACYADRRPSA
jgi:hypothetical protein